MTAVVQARELGKRYRRRWALAGCTLDIPAGRVVGLVGPNGAGKTTLLSLAAGLLSPTAGTIEVCGGRPARDRVRRLGLPPGQRAGGLSGGQRAQLALTLAVARRPELLILDEPVAALDPLARREFLEELRATTASQDLTVVHSSHLVSDVERVCEYLIVLADSRVQIAGDVGELLAGHRRSPGRGSARWPSRPACRLSPPATPGARPP
jgi:ABC-2 type transport system ATP-binding protein